MKTYARRSLLALSIIALHVAPAPTRAQNYTIEQTNLDGGAGASSGGRYSLNGSIGQADSTPQPLVGGSYSLTGGFWPESILTIGDVEVFIAINGPNVIVTWTSGATGFILEGSRALGASANWQPVDPAPTENRFVAPLQGAPQFFRLRRP